MSNLAQRLKSARNQAGLTQAELGKKIGVSQNTIQKVESGGETKYINQLAKALGVNVDWLEFGIGEANTATNKANGETEDLIIIDVLNVEASAGNGSLGDLVEVVKKLHYVPEQFHTYFQGLNPENIRVINIRGDSMYPTFNSGDMIFVDININHFDGDGVYVFNYKGDLYVKRLQNIGGCLLVISDNPTYREWKINEENYDQFYIQGKVKVHQSQKLNFIG